MTSAIIRFKNGVRAALNVGMILGKNNGSRYDSLYIHGSKGSIRSEVEYNQQGKLSYRIFVGDKVIKRKIKAPQNYSLEIAQMCKCFNGEETPHVTKEFSIKNAELIDKVMNEIGY